MKRIIITLTLAVVIGSYLTASAIYKPNVVVIPETPQTAVRQPVKPSKRESNCIDKACSNHHGKMTIAEQVEQNINKCDLRTQYIRADNAKCINKPSETVAVSARVTATTSGVEQWRSIVSKYSWNVETALRIMACESQGNPNAVNSTPPDYSVGLFQINLYGNLANSRPSEAWLKVPENNISYAYQMSNGGTDFSAWSCWH